MKFYKEGDFTADAINRYSIGYENMFESIPVVLKNSHLANALLCELSASTQRDHKFNFLDLGTRYCEVCLLFIHAPFKLTCSLIICECCSRDVCEVCLDVSFTYM